jgi:hypothetical protein
MAKNNASQLKKLFKFEELDYLTPPAFWDITAFS